MTTLESTATEQHTYEIIHPTVKSGIHPEFRHRIPGLEWIAKNGTKKDASLLLPIPTKLLVRPTKRMLLTDPGYHDALIEKEAAWLEQRGYQPDKDVPGEPTKGKFSLWLKDAFNNGYKHAAKEDPTKLMRFTHWLTRDEDDFYVAQILYPGEGFNVLPVLQTAIDRLKNPFEDHLLMTSGRGHQWFLQFGEMLGYDKQGKMLTMAYNLSQPVEKL